MRHLFLILIVAGLCLSAQGDKYLKVPIENIKVINLVLKDQFSGSAIETYNLDKTKYSEFVNALNKATEAPNLKMNITCYRFDIVYNNGQKIQIATNGKGLGPTPVGYFMCSENLILKYFPIKKELYCKPQNPANEGNKNSIGF